VQRILKVVFLGIYRPGVTGLDKIKYDKPLILVGNHTNNLDALLLLSLYDENLRFLGKHTLFRGVKKYFFKWMGVIPVDRTKSKNHDALDEAISSLKSGVSICLFPEGTINRTKELIMPFKYGAVKMARETKCSILPFVISGKYRPFKNELKIEFLDTIEVEDNLVLANEKLMNVVKSTLKKEIVK